jgi:DNA-binding transcriptional MerR regulator
MKDLYSIHEFSKISGIDSTVLRYWGDIGVFSPLKRNPENNYRYYSMAQLLALNFVSTMSDLGIPLKTIAELKEQRNPDDILAILEKRERELDMELRTLRLRSSIIHARQELIRAGLKADEAELAIMRMEEKAIIIWPRNEYQEGDTFIEPLAAFVNQSKDSHVNLSFPVGGYWDSFERHEQQPSCPDHFFSIDPIGRDKLDGGDYLVGYVRGYYGEMGDLPERMASYAKEHSLEFSGPLYTMYLLEETSTDDPSQYLAQSCIAVSKAKRHFTTGRRSDL